MKLRRWRIENGISVEELGNRSGLAASTLYCYENGSRHPRAEAAKRIEAATNGEVTAAELLGIAGSVREEAVPFETAPELAIEARQLGLDPDAIARKAVEDAVKRSRIDAWIAENKEAFAANARDVEENGLWCDRYRMF